MLALFAIGGVNVRAQSVNSTNLLTQAYAVLSVANHDYKGHRVAAMKQIAAAGTVVGITEMGNGKGHEQQVVSDQRLQIATSSLQQATAWTAPESTTARRESVSDGRDVTSQASSLFTQ